MTKTIRFVSRYMGTIRYKKRCMLIKNDSVRFNSMQFNNWKHCVVRKQWTSFSNIFLSVFLNIFLPTSKDQPEKRSPPDSLTCGNVFLNCQSVLSCLVLIYLFIAICSVRVVLLFILRHYDAS